MKVFAKATLSPTTVLAGDSVEFVISLTLGEGYTSGGSRIVFDMPGTVGMSRPSRMHQEDHGYVTAAVSNPEVTYAVRIWDIEGATLVTGTAGSWRGMAARMAVLDLGPGLKPGDMLELRWGDTGRGYGPGTKVTTVVPRLHTTARIDVRYFAKPDAGLPDYGRDIDGVPRPQPDAETALTFAIKPREPHHVRLLRKPHAALLAPHDVFWNVAEAEPTSLVSGPAPARRNDFGVYEYDTPAVQVRSRGLPYTETASMHDVYDGYNLYWGDLHTHSAYSVDCVEREKLAMGPGDLMASARQRAGLDFYAVTDHHQPWDRPRHRLGREAWEATVAAVAKHHEPGAFVVFAGFEFRCPRGDTIVLFRDAPDYDAINGADLVDVRALWDRLGDRDLVTIPHFHNPGRLAEGEWWSPQDRARIEPVLEIFSCHGSYEREDALEHHIPLIKASRPDRYGLHFLQSGGRYGLVCNSDGHKGHVGTNGVTAVFARSLDRDAILDAYRRRHVYGTTNARIRLIFTGNGALMGEVVPNASEKVLAIDAIGEAPLKKVELFRNGLLHQRFAPDGVAFKAELAVRDSEPSWWTVRVTQRDNHIAFSSPIWYNAA